MVANDDEIGLERVREQAYDYDRYCARHSRVSRDDDEDYQRYQEMLTDRKRDEGY